MFIIITQNVPIYKHAPVKEKHLRNNVRALMTKNLHQAIMIRSRLLNKYREGKNETNSCAYKKQRILFVKLLKIVTINFLF